MKKLSVLVVAGLAVSVLALTSCQRRVRTPAQVKQEKAAADAAKAAEEANQKEEANNNLPQSGSKEAFDADVAHAKQVVQDIANDAKESIVSQIKGDAAVKANFVFQLICKPDASECEMDAEAHKIVLEHLVATTDGNKADAYMATQLAVIYKAHKIVADLYGADGKAIEGVEPSDQQKAANEANAVMVAVENLVKQLQQTVSGTKVEDLFKKEIDASTAPAN